MKNPRSRGQANIHYCVVVCILPMFFRRTWDVSGVLQGAAEGARFLCPAPLGWDVEYQSPSPGCHSWKTTKWLEWKQKPRRKPGLKLIESDRIYRKREMRFEGNVICICVVMLLYFTHLESDGFKFRPTKVWKTMENQKTRNVNQQLVSGTRLVSNCSKLIVSGTLQIPFN